MNSTDLQFGIIVRYKERDLDVLTVRFEAYVVVEKSDADGGDDDAHVLAPGAYQLTSAEQRWCVG